MTSSTPQGGRESRTSPGRSGMTPEHLTSLLEVAERAKRIPSFDFTVPRGLETVGQYISECSPAVVSALITDLLSCREALKELLDAHEAEAKAIMHANELRDDPEAYSLAETAAAFAAEIEASNASSVAESKARAALQGHAHD